MAIEFNKSSLVDDVSNLVSLMNRLKKDDKETPVQRDAMDTYSSYIFTSFEDNELETHINALDNWYNQNFDDLSSNDIERYELIKRRIPEHQKRYRTFDAKYSEMHDSVEEMKILLAGGEDENGTPTKGFNDLDDEGKALLAGLIKEKEINYIKNRELIEKQYNDLLNHPSGKFNTENTAINSWDEIYQLGLVSIEDHVLDKEELYTLSRSIDYGNLEEYNRYKGIQDQTMQDSRMILMQDARPLIAEVNYKGKLIDDYNYIMELANNASKGDVEAENQLDILGPQLVHSTEPHINPYAESLPSGYISTPVNYTWQNLLDQEANELIDFYQSSIGQIQSNLYQLDQGFQNVSRGKSLTQGMPITYSGWGGKITDPYVRYEPKKEKTNVNNVSNMTAGEQKIVNDYKIDYERKQKIDKWFSDYPIAGSSPEEKEAFGTLKYHDVIKETRASKKAELNNLKEKWYKKQEHSYGGEVWDARPQDNVYEIYKKHSLKPTGKMF